MIWLLGKSSQQIYKILKLGDLVSEILISEY